MFGIGGPELVFIFILALLIFGPKRLPQIGRTIGKGMAEFRRASTELQRAVNTQLEEPETPAWRAQPAAAAAPAVAVPAATPAGTIAKSETVLASQGAEVAASAEAPTTPSPSGDAPSAAEIDALIAAVGDDADPTTPPRQ